MQILVPLVSRFANLAQIAYFHTCDFLHGFADLICMEKCRICQCHFAGRRAHLARQTKAICQACWKKLSKNHPLSAWLTVDNDKGIVIASGMPYKGEIKKLIHKLKYGDDRLLACDLAHFLVSAWPLVVNGLNGVPPVLVPIPLSKDRLRTRGFNQAELLATYASRILQIPVETKALKRVKSTKPQFGLLRDERRENLANAFSAEKFRLQNKAVILVDDIYTSGATLSEAARVVLAAGASNLAAITVARA